MRLGRGATRGLEVRPTPSGAGILHLGLGNFHRAHQAVYTAAAVTDGGGDWGIIGVASRSRAVVDAMRSQDLLYSVAQISPSGMSVSVPAVHTGVFVGSEEPCRVISTLADPAIRIVTLTVTENGYSSSPSSGGLNTSDPVVVADLRGAVPRTTIGQLARGLQLRAQIGAPVSILSCDNLAANGAHTESLVREFLAHLSGPEGADTLAYLDQAVTFPSSMVDRIVPTTDAGLRERVFDALGVWDDASVPAEPFSMWAIEDRFAAGRPTWEAGGAIFTDEVHRYEQLKVRLLNGTHSLIAYLGALSGAATIPASIALSNIAEAARAVLRREYEPSVEVPSGLDVRDYEAQLFERWGNTALGHRTTQVGADGSVKLRQRIPEPVARALDNGEMPHMIALTVAAYLCCMAPLPRFSPGPFADAMTDTARGRLVEIAGLSRHGADVAHRVIRELELFGRDLATRITFIARVGELIDIIVRSGVRAAIADALDASAAPVPADWIPYSTAKTRAEEPT